MQSIWKQDDVDGTAIVAGAAIDLLYSGIGCLAACVIWTVQFVLLMKERMKREKIEKNI